ncbi:MAG: SAF domain-containing protein [Arcanobacterium sp.]|nr:SAF domain-containing protein [Arcanobacterium sp.]
MGLWHRTSEKNRYGRSAREDQNTAPANMGGDAGTAHIGATPYAESAAHASSTARSGQLSSHASHTRYSSDEQRYVRRHSHSAAQHRAIRRPSPVRALMWRWRWVLVALVVALVLQSVLFTMGLSHKPMNEVVVAAHDLSTGTTLSRSELRLKNLPAEAIPSGTVSSLDAVLGRTLVAPLPAGAPIISRQLLTSDFTAAAPQGTVITAVTLDNPATAAILRPGDRIQLYSPPADVGVASADKASKSEARQLTASAIVMSTPSNTQDKGILGDTRNKDAIFVAIPESDASLVIGLGAKASLHAVIVSQ